MTAIEPHALVIEHVAWEGPGRISTSLSNRCVRVERRNLIRGDFLAAYAPRDLAGVVVMGGPMGATDTVRYPALAAEIDFIRRLVEANVPVLGVCLGHQLLALAFGADHRRDVAPEIGVGTVTLCADSALGRAGDAVDVLHWHRDQITLPSGGHLLASSEVCEVQAFRLGSAMGLQFHLEASASMVRRWLEVPEMSVDMPDPVLTQADLSRVEPRLESVAQAVFGEFAARVAERAFG